MREARVYIQPTGGVYLDTKEIQMLSLVAEYSYPFFHIDPYVLSTLMPDRVNS